MKIVLLVVRVLQEIFDEAAYARFLARHGISRTGDSYSDFLREKHGHATPKRCC